MHIALFLKHEPPPFKVSRIILGPSFGLTEPHGQGKLFYPAQAEGTQPSSLVPNPAWWYSNPITSKDGWLMRAALSKALPTTPQEFTTTITGLLRSNI